MSLVGQKHQIDDVSAASGVPPIASESCALHDGPKGHNGSPTSRINRNLHRARGSSKRRLEWAGNYAACRRVISASAASPSAVNEYGELCARLLFFTKRLRLRYCMRAFIDWGGKLNAFVTSLIRNSPDSKITESTLRMRSDSTGRRSAWARRAD